MMRRFKNAFKFKNFNSGWYRRLQDHFRNNFHLDEQEKVHFWEHSLRQSSSFQFGILLVNIFVLSTVSLQVFMLIGSEHYAGYKALLSNLLGWLFNSVLCVTILLLIKLIPKKLELFTGKSLSQIWFSTGNYLLCIRFLTLVARVLDVVLGLYPACYVIATETGFRQFILPSYFILLDVCCNLFIFMLIVFEIILCNVLFFCIVL